MSQNRKKDVQSSYSRPIRILALILSILVTGGVVTYLIMFFMNLFG